MKIQIVLRFNFLRIALFLWEMIVVKKFKVETLY